MGINIKRSYLAVFLIVLFAVFIAAPNILLVAEMGDDIAVFYSGSEEEKNSNAEADKKSQIEDQFPSSPQFSIIASEAGIVALRNTQPLFYTLYEGENSTPPPETLA